VDLRISEPARPARTNGALRVPTVNAWGEPVMGSPGIVTMTLTRLWG